MRVDSHHHLWDPARRDYPWMGAELAAIRRRFGPEDLAPLLHQNQIDRNRTANHEPGQRGLER